MTKTKITNKVVMLTPALNAEVKAEQANYVQMKRNRRMERAAEDKKSAEAHKAVVEAVKVRYYKSISEAVKAAIINSEILEP